MLILGEKWGNHPIDLINVGFVFKEERKQKYKPEI